jgi:hypothetical protein
MIKGKENTHTRCQTQGETNDFVGLSKTPAVGMKLNEGDI